MRDYVAKAGLTEHLTSVTVAEGLNFREVTATATADTKPFFMHMIGIDEFDVHAASTAEQRITNVEISLVLDVSGSMIGTKLANLKTAASEFVDTVLSSDGENRVSISLVPYNGQVNLGPNLRAKYNITNLHGVANVNCVDLPASVYNTTTMSRTTAMPLTAHADTFSSTSTSNLFSAPSSNTPTATNRWCPQNPENIVRLPSNNIAALQGYINAMTAIGATSTNAGLKWGLALIDPESRQMFSEFVSASLIDRPFEGRPFDYSDPEALKVIVLMTDGDHFAEERMNDAYKTGTSTIYKSTGDSNYSIFHTSKSGTSKYWVPHRNSGAGEWRAAAWNSGSGVSAALPWVQVWSELRVKYVAWQLYARALGTDSTTRTSTYNTWVSTFRSLTPTTAMDNQLQQICANAKANPNLIIYGIAFDAPTHGQQQIRMCTTGYDPAQPAKPSAYYFASTPANIKDAFRTIATNISQLRLTQ